MKEFNFWDLWGYEEVTIKLKTGNNIQARIICVEEFDEPDSVYLSTENAEGFDIIFERDIDSIIVSAEDKIKMITRNENGHWIIK